MFCFAVTDRAVYVPATRLVFSGDPHYLKKVPLSEVREVRVEPIRPYAAWVFAAIMIAAGLMVGASMVLPFLLHIEGTYRMSAWPLALLVGGGLLPFVARGRRRLVVAFQKGGFCWTPPLVVDRESREQVQSILTDILRAAANAGMVTVGADEGVGAGTMVAAGAE
ncbi:MAG: hypothetical protein K0Q72_1243 [Armatimonadetes bacterium]|nr:hypothetical protein [Armatimonadota bacterium]